MRVLVADSFSQSGLDGLASAGCEVDSQPTLSGQALVDAVASTRPDVLIVRSTKVPKEVLAAGPLKLVVRAGAGYNTIDVAAASQLGIYVSNCPGKNSIAVAELAFGLIAALDRRIVDASADLRRGAWEKGTYSKAQGLFGRTLGLVGLGQIGQEMIPRAHGFGMKVVAWSRSLTPERAEELGVEYAASPLDVARAADIVSLHVAAKADTLGLVNAEFVEAMKPGAFLINTSRGDVLDTAAVMAGIESKGLRVGLDVYEGEPSGSQAEFSAPILDLPGVIGTPHIGASTEQAQQAIGDEAVRIVTEFATKGTVPNVVNLATATGASHTLVVRHLDRPGVLAGVLGALRDAELNVQEMENVVFDTGETAVARINVQGAPADATTDTIRAIPDIIEASWIEL